MSQIGHQISRSSCQIGHQISRSSCQIGRQIQLLRSPDPAPQISRSSSSDLQIQLPDLQIQLLRSPDPAARSPDPAARSPDPAARSPDPAARSPDPAAKSSRSGIRQPDLGPSCQILGSQDPAARSWQTLPKVTFKPIFANNRRFLGSSCQILAKPAQNGLLSQYLPIIVDFWDPAARSWQNLLRTDF